MNGEQGSDCNFATPENLVIVKEVQQILEEMTFWGIVLEKYCFGMTDVAR